MYHNHSDKWDDKEKKMDESDMKPEEGPKVEVQVNTGEHQQELPLSGLFCCFCHDYAIHIYDGMSLCHDCFTKEMTDLIKQRRNK